MLLLFKVAVGKPFVLWRSDEALGSGLCSAEPVSYDDCHHVIGEAPHDPHKGMFLSCNKIFHIHLSTFK